MLQTPTTPEGESWNTTVQQTPGVIGAQEVYRYAENNHFFFNSKEDDVQFFVFFLFRIEIKKNNRKIQYNFFIISILTISLLIPAEIHERVDYKRNNSNSNKNRAMECQKNCHLRRK